MQSPTEQLNTSSIKSRFKSLALQKNVIKNFTFRPSAVFVGFLASQKLSFAGEFYIGEILSLIYILINFQRIKAGRPIKTLLFMGFLWSVCQFISDQINQTAFFDSFKGVGAPIVFVSTIVALSMFFIRDIRRMPSFLLGVYLGYITEFVFFQNEYFAGNPWKWGLGLFVLGIFSIYFTFFLTKKRNSYLIFFVAAFLIVGLLNDSRSMAIFPIFATIAYILLRSRRFGKVLRVFRGKFAITKLAAVIFTLLFTLNTAFTAIFSSSWILDKLPADSAKKFQMQAGGEYGALLGGRNEVLVSTIAFLDKPFFGHGSWAKDKAGYSDKLSELRYDLGYAENSNSSYKSDLIPAHSYFMGALVWAGIGGGLFWLFMIRWLLIQFLNNFEYLGFYFYNGLIAIMWDIMFSPFGANARWIAATFVASLYCYTKYISANKVIT